MLKFDFEDLAALGLSPALAARALALANEEDATDAGRFQLARVAEMHRETLTVEDANYESRRCLSCGNCCECDGCLGACPEDAVIKLGVGHGYMYDYDKCTGCGICYEQCPVHSIEMFAEPE